jgi:antitoxin component of RelBE/YafQ-DinJ toxin-antitoxin module
MEKEGKNTKVLRIRIDQELLDQLKDEAKRLDTDISSYVRWCLRTGLYMKDLNLFLRSTSKEEDLVKLTRK